MSNNTNTTQDKLFGSNLKVNDIIEINGIVCQVEEINFRTPDSATNYIVAVL